MYTYAFLLGREPALSLAELKSIFSHVEQSGHFALIEEEESIIRDRAPSLGGTIKIAIIHEEGLKKNDILPLIVKKIADKAQEGKKLRIAIDSFVPALNSLVFKAKDALKEQGCSIRVVQHDNGRTKTATTIHEKLVEQGVELVLYADKAGFTIAETIWVQDIESYSQRDMDRDRSMTVGMMPPKIAQIMINMATKGNRDMVIWDPFCGLGTTLIEALHSGFTSLKGSDLEPKMVQTTQKNTESQKVAMPADIETFVLDATTMDTHSLQKSTAIVTEGMLGKNFTPHTITQQLAFKERKELTELYSGFLNSAYKNKNIQSMCFCLPFWNIGSETLYMPEIGALSRDWTVEGLCMRGKRYLSHMRPGQCVGREIILLKR